MLTPIDIHNMNHKPGRGYSKKEMDEFLEQISEDYETLYKENRDLKDKLEKLSDGVQYYKSMEGTLQKALVLAEKTSKDTIEAANEKAALIEKEARFKAEQLVKEGNLQYENIRQQCLSIVQQYNQFKLQFKQIAIKQIELFDSDFYEIYTNDFLTKINESIDKHPVVKTVPTPESKPVSQDNASDKETHSGTKTPTTDINISDIYKTESVKETSVKPTSDKPVADKPAPDIGLFKEIESEPVLSEDSASGFGDTKRVDSDAVKALLNKEKAKAEESEKSVAEEYDNKIDEHSKDNNAHSSKEQMSKEDKELEALINDLKKELSSNVSDNGDKKPAFEFLDDM